MTQSDQAVSRPTMYNRSVRLPEQLREHLYELAVEHERTLADEIRHGLRLYVALNHRQRREPLR